MAELSATGAGLSIEALPCLGDNYAGLLVDRASGAALLFDAPDPEPILAALTNRGLRLTHILVTHGHGDHVQGIPAVKAATGAEVLAPADIVDRVPGADRGVSDGETLALGPFRLRALATPGHTRACTSYVLEGDTPGLFCGDTMFALGCGRLFEGDAELMWSSLSKIRALPDETICVCGHEYTANNARYARAVDPDNAALVAYSLRVAEARARGEPTVPFPLGPEKAANPFLRADDPALAARLGLAGEAPARVFAALRTGKDRFA